MNTVNKKLMKILQIAGPWISTPPTGYGGTEWVVFYLTEELIKRGHDVTLFATGDSKTSAKLRYVFSKDMNSTGLYWHNAALPAQLHYDQAIKYANSNNFDLVHLHLSADQDIAMFPFIENSKIPCIITHHSQWPYDKFSNMNEYFLKYYGSKINVVSISRAMQRCLPKQLNSVGIVYNGVNFDVLEFNPKPKGNYLTWLGTIERKKGIKEVIEAVKMTDEKLIFAGKTDYDPEFFEKEIKPLIDGDQIKFLGVVGALKRNDLLRNAKAFLNYLKWEEPFGMVMAESMACGTPVITTPRGAATELVVDGKTGFFVDNKEEMIKAIQKVAQIDRQFCHNYIVNKFSAEKMTSNYIEIYNKVVKKHSMLDKVKKISQEIIPMNLNIENE